MTTATPPQTWEFMWTIEDILARHNEPEWKNYPSNKKRREKDDRRISHKIETIINPTPPETD